MGEGGMCDATPTELSGFGGGSLGASNRLETVLTSFSARTSVGFFLFFRAPKASDAARPPTRVQAIENTKSRFIRICPSVCGRFSDLSAFNSCRKRTRSKRLPPKPVPIAGPSARLQELGDRCGVFQTNRLNLRQHTVKRGVFGRMWRVPGWGGSWASSSIPLLLPIPEVGRSVFLCDPTC